MFNILSGKLNTIFASFGNKRFFTENEINNVMREIRIALLEADVSILFVKEFINKVKSGIEEISIDKNVSLVDAIIKIVQDNLTNMLGEEYEGLKINSDKLTVIMMVGLQGSGKTTTTAKFAHKLQKNDTKVLLASLDTQRPAAQEQLEILSRQIDCPTIPIIKGQNPLDITKRAINAAEAGKYNVLILDTAGRTYIDEELMIELVNIKNIAKPKEIMLVVDSLIGQDAINVAVNFNNKLRTTGIILTRIDGDGRGGAAISMRSATGCPIKYLGTGEKMEDIEEFHPERIASRILDMGDIISLAEKAEKTISKEEATHLADKLRQGKFDLDDLVKQLKNLKKMGGVQKLLGFLPGVSKIKQNIAHMETNEKQLTRQEAIILAMTPYERKNPEILNTSRKRRVAKGSGTNIQEVNRVLKRYHEMLEMIQKISKMDKKSLMQGDFEKVISQKKK